MHFAHPLPWWLALLLAAAIAAVAYGEYRRPLSPLTRNQRGILVALRVLALVILVDASRSMRLGDADGQTRVARAGALLNNELGESLSSHFKTELYTVGEGLTPAKVDGLTADFRRTDLSGALTAVRERYRGQRVAGIIVLSDGGDTGGSRGSGGSSEAGSAGRAGGEAGGPPVFAVGIGSPDGPKDREVLGI